MVWKFGLDFQAHSAIETTRHKTILVKLCWRSHTLHIIFIQTSWQLAHNFKMSITTHVFNEFTFLDLLHNLQMQYNRLEKTALKWECKGKQNYMIEAIRIPLRWWYRQLNIHNTPNLFHKSNPFYIQWRRFNFIFLLIEAYHSGSKNCWWAYVGCGLSPVLKTYSFLDSRK